MIFEFVGIDEKTGTTVKRTVNEENLSALMLKLKKEGLRDIKINRVKREARKKKSFTFLGTVSRKEVKLFTRQMASTIGAGFLLTDALESVSEDLENKYFRKVIENIKEEVNAGMEFSDALSKYPHIFPISYTSIIKSGEATGWLNTTMANLAKYLEDSDRLHEKVKTAVTYPLFVFFFAHLIIGFILVFIIPRFRGIYTQLNAELPVLTQIVIGSGEFLLEKMPVLLLSLLAAVLLFWASLKFKKTRYFWDMCVFKIPIIGKHVIHKGVIARFCRGLGFLIKGGVPLSKSLRITGDIVDNLPMKKSVEAINEHIISGGMISEKLKTQKLCPNFVYKMVSLGEKSGNLSEMLERSAEYYEEEIEFSIHKLTSLLEPVLIVFIGSFVFVIVIALYLPVFQISKHLG